MRISTNNFDALRFLAASMVLVSHAVPITFGDNQHEILFRISGGQTTAGELAVVVFFAMSGYLIAASYLRSNSASAFLAARGLRIIPALAVTVLITALLIGPCVTSLSMADYFSANGTWRFLWRNMLIRQNGDLPGVFPGNPIQGIVNGSLWTLEYEVECYGVILCLGVLGFLGKYPVLAVWILGLIASALWFGGAFGPFFSVFIGGALLRVWKVPMDGRVAGVWTVPARIPAVRGDIRGLRRLVPGALVLHPASRAQPAWRSFPTVSTSGRIPSSNA